MNKLTEIRDKHNLSNQQIAGMTGKSMATVNRMTSSAIYKTARDRMTCELAECIDRIMQFYHANYDSNTLPLKDIALIIQLEREVFVPTSIRRIAAAIAIGDDL